jgi:putative hemolysin
VADLYYFIASLVVLLIFDFFAIAARSSFFVTNHARLLALREHMESQVNRTTLLLHVMPRLKASLNLALMLDRFLIVGVVMYYVFLQSFASNLLISLGILLLTAFVIFWFEWAVDRYVSRDPEHWALRLTTFVRLLMGVFSIFLALPFSLSGETESSLEITTTVTEDELKTLVDAGQAEGIFEQGERRMIYSIFQLGETLAREIMVPRIDMLALDVLTPLPDAVDALLRSGHSRVPVFEETVDKTLGLLYAKDLLRVWREGSQLESLRDLLRPAYFIPEAKKIDELLAEMQSQRIHMAIVVDEYGGVAGLVTLEDVVEEILGEIRDEYDQAEEAPYQVLKDGDFIFQGRVDLDDFNEILGSSLPKDEADTIGGLIYSRIGRVPVGGETVQEDNLVLTVEQVSGRRIRKVRAHRMPAESASEEEKNGDNG